MEPKRGSGNLKRSPREPRRACGQSEDSRGVRGDQGESGRVKRIPGEPRESQGIPQKARGEQEIRKNERNRRETQGKLEEPRE